MIGGIAALLLFFHGSLSYVPFLRSQHSVGDAIHAVTHLNHWLASGFPYKGEDWGIWSPSILYVQRHLLGAIGILCLVLTFLVEFYKQVSAGRERAAEEGPVTSPLLRSFIFSGGLIGLSRLLEHPILLSGLAFIGCLFRFCPGAATSRPCSARAAHRGPAGVIARLRLNKPIAFRFCTGVTRWRIRLSA